MSDDDLRAAILRIRRTRTAAGGSSGRPTRPWTTAHRKHEVLPGDRLPRLARAEDDSVALFRTLGDPDISEALRTAVGEAIGGTPEEMRYFLEYGQYEIDA
ncbi:ALF repeat-containing protein [Streptomyces sp. LN549]|uniref:ALF repeat-containing protein n=1 Tax=Streptomyces sp. LN549 TaxID=3112979 RepID=UPI0037225452